MKTHRRITSELASARNVAAGVPLAGSAGFQPAVSQICNLRNARKSGRGRAFTLIELLVVIAILAILASLLLPALSAAINSTRKKKALMEMHQLAAAIAQYEMRYSRMPTSKAAAQAASPDFTFGTLNGATLLTGGKGQTLPQIANNNGTGYQAPNSEVMVILMDETAFPDGTPTLNANHALNTDKYPFVTLKMTGDKKSPGVGQDFIYRDPWGNPYIISVDMNDDNKVRDGLYSLQVVSGSGNGGLIPAVPGTDTYEVSATVVIWSLGPDGNASTAFSATVSPNKDNIHTF